MALKLREEFEIKYVYDFAVSGGAVSTISLVPQLSWIALDEGVIIKDLTLRVITAFTSGGTPTVTFGNSSDVDGFFVDAWAAGLQTANSILKPGVLDGALMWNSTVDAITGYRVGSAANTKDVVMAVGTAALTAGKCEIVFDCMRLA